MASASRIVGTSQKTPSLNMNGNNINRRRVFKVAEDFIFNVYSHYFGYLCPFGRKGTVTHHYSWLTHDFRLCCCSFVGSIQCGQRVTGRSKEEC